MLVALALALLVAPPGGTAEISGERLRSLRPPPEAPAQGPWVERRTLSFAPAPGGVVVRGRWHLKAIAPGWFSGQVFGPTPGLRVIEARWGGQPATLTADASGVTAAARVQGAAELTVEAFVPGDPAQAALSLEALPAVRGRIEARAPEGLVPAVTVEGLPALQVGEAAWSGGRAIGLAFVTPPAPSGERPPVVVAKVGVGLTVGDAELRGRARAVWEIRQGEVAAVELDVAGVGADLEVRGPNLRAWNRSGDRVRAELQAPARDRVELELAWTTAIGKAAESRAELPRLAAVGVFHGEAALQLARDGEVEAVPETPGWTPVASSALPGWAQGLVEGTATASLRGGTGGSLSLLRFVPIAGPPVVVDVAAYTVATSREGRALIRAHYEVRNERAAHLRVQPPPGFKIIGVRVGGKAATPARTREGAWIVPLLRSVETVGGLLSFPVEVNLLGEQSGWARREARSLPLPSVDAPVAVSRVTLHLPPGYRSRKRPGEGDVVAAFTRGEGITYGLGVGEVGAAQADMMFQDAVQSWMKNDFKAAQGKLDELRAMGASNENIARLQGNLDVVAGKVDASKDVTIQRRVREQAKARALGEVQAQAELKKKAEEERARGDYEAAASSYGQALQVGDKLAALEQDESVDQRSFNRELEKEIAAVNEASNASKRGRAANLAKGKKKAPSSEGKAVYSFSDDTIEGELVRPDGEKRPEEPAARDDADGIADVSGISVGAVSGSAQDRQVAQEYRVEGVALGGQVGGDEGPVQPAPPVEAPAPDKPMPPSPEPVVTKTLALETVDIGERRSFASVLSRVPGRFAGRSRRGRRAEAAGPAAGGGGGAKAPAMPTGATTATTRNTTPTAPDPTPADAPVNLPAGMPTPVVHASALSVVVPTVGEAVRYQRLLLPAGAAYAVEISAKEPLFAKE